MKCTAAVLIASTLVLPACSSGPPATVAISNPVVPVTALVTPSTTAVPETATTTLAALEVEGVPAEALALIGAPMPEVNLTLGSPDDFERWLREYERWNIWLGANPNVDSAVLAVALVPGGEEERNWIDAPALDVGAILVSVGILDVEKFEYATESLDQGILQVLLWSRRGGTAWAIDTDGVVIGRLEPEPSRGFGVSTLVLVRSENGVWRLREWRRS